MLLSWFSPSRSKAPWRYVQWACKLQRSECQLSFLLQCRRERLIPCFITQPVQQPPASRHKRIRQKRRFQYCLRLLSDATQDKFAEKGFPLEAMQALPRAALDFYPGGLHTHSITAALCGDRRTYQHQFQAAREAIQPPCWRGDTRRIAPDNCDRAAWTE